MTGALLIDKPAGPTSHDIVAFVRRSLKVDRAGHTGTLDPLATGLLIVLVGSATRLARFLAADEKEYIADVRLGVATPTYDAASLSDGVRRSTDDGRRALSDGQSVTDIRWPTDGELEAVLQKFRGPFLQVPPAYSAKKIASVPAYEKARKNQQVELKPVSVTVRTLEVLRSSGLGVRPSALDHRSSVDDRSSGDHRSSDIDDGLLRLRVVASAGFYVRSLAHDIGEALGCGAHLEALRRTRVGRFRVDDALSLDRVESDGEGRLTPASDLLGHMTAVTVTEQGVQRIAHGNPVTPSLTENGVSPLFPLTVGDAGFCRVLDGSGRLLAVAEPRPGGVLQPVVVLR